MDFHQKTCPHLDVDMHLEYPMLIDLLEIWHSKQLLPGLLVDSADYHPEKELFPEGNSRGK